MAKKFTRQNVIDIIKAKRAEYNDSGYQSETPIDEILDEVESLVV